MVKHNAKKISRSLTDSEALIEAVEHFRFLPFSEIRWQAGPLRT